MSIKNVLLLSCILLYFTSMFGSAINFVLLITSTACLTGAKSGCSSLRLDDEHLRSLKTPNLIWKRLVFVAVPEVFSQLFCLDVKVKGFSI